MTIEIEIRNNQSLPKYILNGNAARFIIPVAKEVCKGTGFDIGCGTYEWKLPGSIPIDPKINMCFHAMNLPSNILVDYIFSSHCLEHIIDYKAALKYWTDTLRSNGILFLYLPHPDCIYWRPENKLNDTHYHSFTPEQMFEYFKQLGYKNINVSGRDLAYGFAIFGEKK